MQLVAVRVNLSTENSLSRRYHEQRHQIQREMPLHLQLENRVSYEVLPLLLLYSIYGDRVTGSMLMIVITIHGLYLCWFRYGLEVLHFL